MLTLSQNGGQTCSFSCIIAHKYPIYFSKGVNKYSYDTYTFLNSYYLDLFREEQENDENTLKVVSSNIQSYIEEKKSKFDEKHKFERAYLSYAIVVADTNEQQGMQSTNINFYNIESENKNYMLVIFENRSEEEYNLFEIGQVITLNNLTPESYLYKQFNYDLVFRYTNKSSMADNNQFEKNLSHPKFDVSYDLFRYHLDEAFENHTEDTVLQYKQKNLGFVTISGVILKVFKSTNDKEVGKRSFIKTIYLLTTQLNFVTIDIHSQKFMIKMNMNVGEIVTISNLIYNTSCLFNGNELAGSNRKTGNSHQLVVELKNHSSVKKISEINVTQNKFMQLSQYIDDLQEYEPDLTNYQANIKMLDKFYTTNFTNVNRKEPKGADELAAIKELKYAFALYKKSLTRIECVSHLSPSGRSNDLSHDSDVRSKKSAPTNNDSTSDS